MNNSTEKYVKLNKNLNNNPLGIMDMFSPPFLLR
jgi:hypothetical protein